MGFAWNILHYLESVCNANFWTHGFFEQPVVKPFSVANTVTVRAESHPCGEDQIKVLRFESRKMFMRFLDVEFSFRGMGEVFDDVKVDCFIFHPGEHEGFCLMKFGKKSRKIHFAVDWQIKCYFFGFFEQ